ncbi:hypothetical protein [Streptococcus pyogenes]|uniref:hypothetical protein n=1 Tax=Streptococcus pyogenes TaxID=1314 RepID=UPI00109C62FC|nr:hypothetical protein [Streptococcus pyogenes]QCK51775.1 hypothetical protein ETT57_00600 [Streptococcus pyogenes]HER0072328.1 hypothetical protein [Streptococcus pyogenes]HES8318929.1 hypothetical protein [Streptococcus pyogenes]
MSFEIFTLIIGWKLVGYRVMECGSSFKQGDYRLVVHICLLVVHICLLNDRDEMLSQQGHEDKADWPEL